MIDQNDSFLYRNSLGMFYGTTMLPTNFYPPFEKLIRVYHDRRRNIVVLSDKYSNQYRILKMLELGTFTWKSIPMTIHVERATPSHYIETCAPLIELVEKMFARTHLSGDQGMRKEPIGLTIFPPHREPQLE